MVFGKVQRCIEFVKKYLVKNVFIFDEVFFVYEEGNLFFEYVYNFSVVENVK